MAKEFKREPFDELDKVQVSPFKNIGLVVLVHLIALIYAILWQLLLTM